MVAMDTTTAAEHIKEYLLDEINDLDGIQRRVEIENGISHPNIQIAWENDGDENSLLLENMEEVADWLNDSGYDYRIDNHKNMSRIYPNTMFLTQKAAEQHLRDNDYRYSNDAHTYAMTSWSNVETQKLWKILREIDWKRFIIPEDVVTK